MRDGLREALGPNVTLVTTEVAAVGRMTVHRAELRADAGPLAGTRVPWGFVVVGKLSDAGDDLVLYAIRTDWPRLGWLCAWSAARMLAQPLPTWAVFGRLRPGAWALRPRAAEGCTVVEPPALRLERKLRRALGIRYARERQIAIARHGSEEASP